MTDFLNNKAVGLFNDLDRLFGSIVDGGRVNNRAAILPIDVEYDKDAYTVTADLPGFSENEVDVEFKNGFVKISAESSKVESNETANDSNVETDEKAEIEKATSKRGFRERVAYEKVERSVKLTKHVDEDNITAELKNGILTVTLPIVPDPESKKINVTYRG